MGLVPDGDRFPELGQQAPQYVLEELLRQAVADLPTCKLVVGSRVSGIRQTADAVYVTVADGAGGEGVVISEYVVGCDGPNSVVRAAIGSTYVGDHALRPNFGMVFRAPRLSDQIAHGAAVHYWIVNPVAPAMMGPLDLNGTWWFIAFDVERERGERDARRLIDAATGVRVDAKILSTDPWTARMQLVDRGRDGRVFLAGDAAHLNPPFGGHGLNTGFGDAVDLGWKLAATLDGWGGPKLLDTYETERRPVHTRVINAATENNNVLAVDLLAQHLDADGDVGKRARLLAHQQIQLTKDAEFHALELVLGARYESPVITADGARLAHTWLRPGHSIYDELGDGLTLLVLGAESTETVEATVAAARTHEVPLEVVDLATRGLRERYGDELILVRPDQHVAWRGDIRPEDAPVLIDRARGALIGAPRSWRQ